jgi:hypothetical protein
MNFPAGAREHNRFCKVVALLPRRACTPWGGLIRVTGANCDHVIGFFF